jgi:hypothetical protein
MKYPNLLYTALLSAFLLVPFAIRNVAPALEPYPAVLLPGAGSIKMTEGKIDLDRISIYGRAAGRDVWTRLSPVQFLNPIPPEFFPTLAQRYFGLSRVGPIAQSIRWTGLVITIDTHKVSEEEVRNAKQWFRARLNGSGCDDNVLRITQEVVTLRQSDGAEIAVRYQDDKVFELR